MGRETAVSKSMQCVGPCDQGRKPCTDDACATDDGSLRAAQAIVWWVVVAMLMWAAIVSAVVAWQGWSQ